MYLEKLKETAHSKTISNLNDRAIGDLFVSIKIILPSKTASTTYLSSIRGLYLTFQMKRT